MSSPDVPSPSLSFDQLSVYFSQFAEIVGQQLYVRFPFIFFTGKPGGGGNIDFGGATISGADLAPSLPQIVSVGAGASIVKDGSSATGYSLKSITAGPNTTIVTNTNDVQISSVPLVVSYPVSFGGPWSTNPLVTHLDVQHVGNNVSVLFQLETATGGGSAGTMLSVAAPLPAGLWPTADQFFQIHVQSNAVMSVGSLCIRANGNIEIGTGIPTIGGVLGNFSNTGGNNGWLSKNITYQIVNT